MEHIPGGMGVLIAPGLKGMAVAGVVGEKVGSLDILGARRGILGGFVARMASSEKEVGWGPGP